MDDILHIFSIHQLRTSLAVLLHARARVRYWYLATFCGQSYEYFQEYAVCMEVQWLGLMCAFYKCKILIEDFVVRYEFEVMLLIILMTSLGTLRTNRVRFFSAFLSGIYQQPAADRGII